MITVGNVIDRLFRQYLEPPDAQPAACRLDGAITSTDTSIGLDNFEVPEDEMLLRQGVLCEIGSELVRITAYASGTATVERGVLGTIAAAHDDDASVKLAPPFLRIDALNSIGENVSMMGGQLFTTRTVYVSFLELGAAPVEALAVSVVRIVPDDAWRVGSGSTVTIQGSIVDYHPDVGGRAVVADGYRGGAYVTYRRRTAAPTVESDELTDLGIEDEWIPAILAGAAADLLVGRDIPASHTNWIGQVLETEAIRVGTRTQLAGSLRGYQQLLLSRMATEMQVEYKPTIRLRNPFSQATS